MRTKREISNAIAQLEKLRQEILETEKLLGPDMLAGFAAQTHIETLQWVLGLPSGSDLDEFLTELATITEEEERSIVQ